MLDITAHAPAGALCAGCGCGCAGETVVIERRAGPLGGTLRTYRHLHSDDCQAARTRSDRFWSNAGARQLAWCDAADAEIAAARADGPRGTAPKADIGSVLGEGL